MAACCLAYGVGRGRCGVSGVRGGTGYSPLKASHPAVPLAFSSGGFVVPVGKSASCPPPSPAPGRGFSGEGRDVPMEGGPSTLRIRDNLAVTERPEPEKFMQLESPSETGPNIAILGALVR